MKFTLSALSLILAAPAFAHEGELSHVHPHGFEAMLVIGLIIAAVYAFWRSK